MLSAHLTSLAALWIAGFAFREQPCQAAEATNLSTSRALPAIRVNKGGHYLETADGRPFFWLGDTAWKLLHSATREECSYFLQTRAHQGFTVLQVVVLAEDVGITQTNALGERPFAGNDPQPFFSRIPDQSLMVGGTGKGGQHLQATRDLEGTYAFVYFPMNDQTATIDLAKLRSNPVRAWWYDPANGYAPPGLRAVSR